MFIIFVQYTDFISKKKTDPNGRMISLIQKQNLY